MTTQPIPRTTDELIAEIEAAAKAAPKGNWIVDENHDEVSVSMGSAIGSPYEYYVHDRWFCESEWSDEDDYAEATAKHIAASRPENVLALIARIRELEQAHRWVSVDERLPEDGQSVIVKQVGFDCSYFAGFVCSKPGFMRVKNPVTGDWYRGFKEWKPVQ